MEKGYFYFLSDEYYVKFHNEKLMTNKETVNGEVHNRPCYYSFQDDDEKQIFLKCVRNYFLNFSDYFYRFPLLEYFPLL